jgi:ABC-type branched-subunit amino acid transport system permease subunit
VPAWLDANLITIVDGVAFGVLLFTIAVGLSLVFGIMDVLNLAHGALYLVGAYLAVRFAGDGSATLGGSWPPGWPRWWWARPPGPGWPCWPGRWPAAATSTRRC